MAKGYKPRNKAAMWEKAKKRFDDRVSWFAFEERIWPEVAEEKWRKGGRKPAK